MTKCFLIKNVLNHWFMFCSHCEGEKEDLFHFTVIIQTRQRWWPRDSRRSTALCSDRTSRDPETSKSWWMFNSLLCRNIYFMFNIQVLIEGTLASLFVGKFYTVLNGIDLNLYPHRNVSVTIFLFSRFLSHQWTRSKWVISQNFLTTGDRGITRMLRASSNIRMTSLSLKVNN